MNKNKKYGKYSTNYKTLGIEQAKRKLNTQTKNNLGGLPHKPERGKTNERQDGSNNEIERTKESQRIKILLGFHNTFVKFHK